MFVHRRIPRISTSSEISFGIGGTCCRWAVGLVSWCSQPSLWALVWGSHWMQIQTICSWCSHTLWFHSVLFMVLVWFSLFQHIWHLGKRPNKNIPAGILQVWLSAGHVICYRGWFLALLASPACRQWAMQTFHLQRKRTLFVCFFLEDLYSIKVCFYM